MAVTKKKFAVSTQLFHVELIGSDLFSHLAAEVLQSWVDISKMNFLGSSEGVMSLLKLSQTLFCQIL